MVAIVANTFNKNNVLLALGLGESENSELLNALICLCILAGVLLNSAKVVFISDRSKSIIKSVHESAPAANHLYCALHLQRNLLDLKGVNQHQMWCFWKSRYLNITYVIKVKHM